LIIHETSKEDVEINLKDAEKSISDMQESGIPISKALKLLEEAKENLKNRKYQSAYDLTNQIERIKENAFSADLLIFEIKSKISSAEEKGLQVEETKRLLNLAIAAFEREDFSTALQRAKDTQLSIVIETKGKINLLRFVIVYWFPLLVVLVGLFIGSYFLRKKLSLVIISRRLNDMQKEEVTINDLMKETQNKYYKEKKINTTEYHKLMYNYEKRLEEVSQSISRLRSKRVGIIEISNEILNLKKDDENIIKLIKNLQDDYFNKRKISRKVYQKRSEQYKIRRIEIEKSMALLEAKLAKKERLDELKRKEKSKKEKISNIRRGGGGFGGQPPIFEPKKRFGPSHLWKREPKSDQPKTSSKTPEDVKEQDKSEPGFTPTKASEPEVKKQVVKELPVTKEPKVSKKFSKRAKDSIWSIKEKVKSSIKESRPVYKQVSLPDKKEMLSQLKNSYDLEEIEDEKISLPEKREDPFKSKTGFVLKNIEAKKTPSLSKKEMLSKLKNSFDSETILAKKSFEPIIRKPALKESAVTDFLVTKEPKVFKKFSNIVKQPISKIKEKVKNQSIKIKNPIKALQRHSYKKSALPIKKEMLSKLKGSFSLEEVEAKELRKDFSEDFKSLRSHGFNVKEKKKEEEVHIPKPEPQSKIPKDNLQNKRSILSHFKEVYKDG